jgi:hypothetical protein
MKSIAIAAAFAAILLLFPAQDALAQGKNCLAYEAAVTYGAPGAVPVVSDALLANWRMALDCLVPIVAAMKDTVKSGSVSAQIRAKYLSATGAIRSMATKIGAGEEANNALQPDQRNPNIDTIAMFQAEFRKVQSIEAFAVLTAGARSDNYDMRLTSILVLGNVIDERFACVPLVQILDPELATAEYAINARANLLGMLSRVAPFVYKEDFANVRNVKAVIAKTVLPNDPRFNQTRLILDNIEQRLNAQTDASNRGVPLDPDARQKCINYMAAYPATDLMTANIKYGP